MTSTIQRLAELVRQAEAKARAQKIGGELQQATDRLRVAEERARRALTWSRETRPALQRELEQADADEQQLKELIRKVAQHMAYLESDNDAEELIAASQVEIETKRKESRAALDAGNAEWEESRRDLRAALEQYQPLRYELERQHPQLLGTISLDDRLLARALEFFPETQLQALAREVEDGAGHFGQLDAKEQYAQLKIWIGRFRRAQMARSSEEDQTAARRLFGRLVSISKQYEPGYIEAFQQGFTTDWDAFIAEAQEQLQQAGEARRRRDAERQAHDQPPREEEQRPAGDSTQAAFVQAQS